MTTIHHIITAGILLIEYTSGIYIPIRAIFRKFHNKGVIVFVGKLKQIHLIAASVLVLFDRFIALVHLFHKLYNRAISGLPNRVSVPCLNMDKSVTRISLRVGNNTLA